MKIIKAEPKHCAEILNCLKILEKEHNVQNMIVFTKESLHDALFGDKPEFEVFVAEKDEGFVGMCIFFERQSTWKGPVIHIEDLIVLPECRGQKIGDKLIEKVIETAKQRGYDRVELDVDNKNEKAIRFYENKGFDCSWNAAKKYL